MSEAWIIDACRTPRGVGKKGKGALTAIHPQRLGATVLAALRDRNGLDTADVDDIIFGTSMQVGTQGGEMFAAFFDKYAFRLETELGRLARSPSAATTVVQPASAYSRQWQSCRA